MSFFSELKRRKVFRVAIAYVLIAWAVAQVLQLLFESFGTPDWAIKSVLVLLVVGLPFALFFAWAYEMTPDGIKRDQDIEKSTPITPETLKKLNENITSANQLYSLVYKSRCNGVADWDLVNSILASSTQNNPANGITGVLVATKSHFLQVLEGEYEILNATYEKIARDTRHNTLQLIAFTEIENRAFGDWAMHGIGLFDLNQDLKSSLLRKFGSDNGNVRFPTKANEVKELLNMLLAGTQTNQAPE